MNEQIEKIVDGVTYVGNPDRIFCEGCVGDNHDYLCDRLCEGMRCNHNWSKKVTEQPIKIYSSNPEFISKLTEKIEGVKTDTGKPRFTLIPPFALEQMAICLTEGLTTHPDKDNWKLVENGKQRFLDSLYRHWNQYQMGEVFDRDNPNVRNLAAIMVNAAFALEFEVNPELNKEIDNANKI